MAEAFEADELAEVAELLQHRFGRRVPFEVAQVEMQLAPEPAPAAERPALHWEASGAQFVVCKAAPGRFQGECFLTGGEAVGAAAREYDDLGDCVTALLRAHADRKLP